MSLSKGYGDVKELAALRVMVDFRETRRRVICYAGRRMQEEGVSLPKAPRCSWERALWEVKLWEHEQQLRKGG